MKKISVIYYFACVRLELVDSGTQLGQQICEKKEATYSYIKDLRKVAYNESEDKDCFILTCWL